MKDLQEMFQQGAIIYLIASIIFLSNIIPNYIRFFAAIPFVIGTVILAILCIGFPILIPVAIGYFWLVFRGLTTFGARKSS